MVRGRDRDRNVCSVVAAREGDLARRVGVLLRRFLGRPAVGRPRPLTWMLRGGELGGG